MHVLSVPIGVIRGQWLFDQRSIPQSRFQREIWPGGSLTTEDTEGTEEEFGVDGYRLSAPHQRLTTYDLRLMLFRPDAVGGDERVGIGEVGRDAGGGDIWGAVEGASVCCTAAHWPSLLLTQDTPSWARSSREPRGFDVLIRSEFASRRFCGL
jgi:hypothetical protein